ncbi:MAG: TrpR-like protein YerC/YecD [Ruminococcaceae bacterium]|nr:TrpR-like protein YerC/YecD [Oscillospiraceae bacterium]
MFDTKNESLSRLFEAILKLETKEECERFFEDICTIKELREIAQRLDVALYLSQGKNYQVISTLTGASTATISRVNKCLNYGSGGYAQMLQRLADAEDKQ